MIAEERVHSDDGEDMDKVMPMAAHAQMDMQCEMMQAPNVQGASLAGNMMSAESAPKKKKQQSDRLATELYRGSKKGSSFF